MSMFNMFSSCFIWLLCILLIAVSFIYLSQKISEQNHKMSSMIGLISSMAEELQSSKKDSKQIPHPIIELSELINVSDDECEDDEEEEDDEDEDDEDDEDEDEDEDDDEDDDDVIIEIDDICKDIFVHDVLNIDATDIKIDDIADLDVTDIEVADIGELNIKSIIITESLEEKINYKKMKIDQLKTIVTQKGLGDASQISKLKKDDLIKLLLE